MPVLITPSSKSLCHCLNTIPHLPCASIKGLELLYQPEVVRLYLALLTCSHNQNTLEAAAGALQNLAAGHWAVSGWNSFLTIIRLHRGCLIVECIPNIKAVSIRLETGTLNDELVQRLTLLSVLMCILIDHHGCCCGVLVPLHCLLSKEQNQDLSLNDIIVSLCCSISN